MKLNNKILMTLLLTPTALMAACGGAGSSKEKVTIWVSETDGVVDSFKALAEKYAADNGLNYTFEVVGVTEAESATQMLTDVSAGADIYCFAQDQFARLVQGGALAKLGQAAQKFVTDNNTADSVAAVKSGSDYYAYPLTADNGYFMYYDKSVVDPSHIDSLEEIIKDCKKAGKNFSMEFDTSGWYLASFFMAYDSDMNQLCHSTWTTDNAGKFTGYDDTYNSDNGVIAARGAQHLVQADNWVSSSAAADLSAATPSAVLVSGTWAYNDVVKALGDNMGVADLPSYTVDGKSYHMGSYSGYKLMGIKPQTDTTRAANLNKLVQYMTSYDAEMGRLTDFGWGPSNIQAQASDTFKANPALAALAEQNKYATPQGQIDGSWWDTTKVLGTSIKNAKADDTDEIKKALENYKAALDYALNVPESVKRAFTVTGSFKSTGADWNSDIEMTEDPTNTWTSEKVTLTEGDEFKVRQGKKWDLSYGSADGGNYKVTAEEAGEKRIKLVTTVDKDGNVTGGTVSIID